MVETLTMYSAPKARDSTNKREWTPTRFLRRGEYDLVNISLIGFDPNTGWTYERCQAAWDGARDAVLAENAKLGWWQWIRRRKLAFMAAALSQRLGY